MIKIRITFSNEEEKNIAIEKINDNFNVLNISKVYSGRGNSRYSNIYIDVNLKDTNKY